MNLVERGGQRGGSANARSILEWGDEEEEPSEDAVRSAVKKKLDDILPKVARVPTVLQPLLAHVPTS